MHPVHLHIACTLPIQGIEVRSEHLPRATAEIAWALRIDVAPDVPELATVYEAGKPREPSPDEIGAVRIEEGAFNLAYVLFVHRAFKRHLVQRGLGPLEGPRYEVLLTPNLAGLDNVTDAGPIEIRPADTTAESQLEAIGVPPDARILPLVDWRGPQGAPSAHQEMARLQALAPEIAFQADQILGPDEPRSRPRMG